MSSKPVSKAEFARMAGISQGAVTRLCQGKLKKAISKGRIDIGHPDAASYLGKERAPIGPGIDPLYPEAVDFCAKSKKWTANAIKEHFKIGSSKAKRLMDTMRANGVGPNTKAKPLQSRKLRDSAPSPPSEPDIPDRLTEFLDWTMRELVAAFGTDTGFKDWLDATKKIEDIEEKRLKNAASEGLLVSREVVRRGVLDHIENAHTRILSDGIKSIVRKIHTLTKAGETLEEMEKEAGEVLTSLIRPAKAKIEKTMKGLHETDS